MTPPEFPPAPVLLPTPVVNDIGTGKTLEWWDEWAPRQVARDGSPAVHGDSLAVEVLRMLPTPTRQDGANVAGPSQLERHSYPLNAIERTPEGWGPYGTAITRWETLTRPAPDPAVDGVLSPPFVEWMMGLPAGWVTEIPGLLDREKLSILGNGVVRQQAACALTMLLDLVDPAVAA